MASFDATVFDKAGLLKGGKSDVEQSASASPLCPTCHSQKTVRCGNRYLADGSSIQRWICKVCGYRFSEKPLKDNLKWQLNTQSALEFECRIRAEEAKNLTQATETKTVAGTPKQPLPPEAKGILTKYMAYIEREGYSEGNSYIHITQRLLKLGANLYDPDNVKTVIARQKWKDSVKMLSVYAYDAFARMEKITWTKPRYRQQESLFYVPDEKELDALIASANSKRMATFLQFLRETFADPAEILGLKWLDISGNIVTINRPVKGHLPGQCQISNKLAAMINRLPKNSDRVFPTSYASMAQNFRILRKRTAKKLENPRILGITFKSFRHFGGSWLAHITEGNVLAVKKALRHKRVENTMKYIHRLEFQDPQSYDVAVAATIDEIKHLAEAGFQKFDEANGIHVYRRPKRFAI